MNWAGYRKMPITSVVCDRSDIRARSKSAHVTDLAANIRATGDEPIHAPTVRWPSKVLLCGRDRVAALTILKAKDLWCRLVECSDAEAADIEASENVYRRRDDRAAALAKAVRTKEALIRAQGGTAVLPTQRVKANARKEIAAAAGVSPGAVKKAEQRAAAAEKAADPFAPPAGPVFVPTLNLRGVPIEEGRATCELAAPTQAAIDACDALLRQALAALKPIENLEVGQRLRADVKRVGDHVRSERPATICPWCKHVPALVGECAPCQTMGYVTAQKAQGAPPECLDGAPLVVYRGLFVTYGEALAGRLPKNGHTDKPGRRITAQDALGNDIPIED